MPKLTPKVHHVSLEELGGYDDVITSTIMDEVSSNSVNNFAWVEANTGRYTILEFSESIAVHIP
jgi:hypothetical protein